MVQRRSRGRMARNNQVLQVREDGDRGAARIDRVIANMRNNESATMVICKNINRVGVAATDSSYTITFGQLSASDEFISMAQQYNTFRVKSMRFEVFHTNPTTTSPIAFSTVHGDFPGDPPPAWVTEQSVIDAPDAMYLEPGSKKQTFYWNARGVLENTFQDVNSFTNYGGLRYYVAGGTAGTAATIVSSFVVVFRGRH